MGRPLVSVILPAYNAEPFLDSAICSILRQTYENFELIIVNDGSSDATPQTIQRYAEQDGRIKTIHNDANRGLIASLNLALARATGEFVARQDADDISSTDRLGRQVEFLVSRPDVGLVGSAMEMIDAAGTPWQIYRQPETDSLIRFRMLFNNALVHTSVMFRSAIAMRHGLQYDGRFQHVEDYDLWSRMLAFTKGHNLQDPLVRYRVLSSSISQQKAVEQSHRANAISDRQLHELNEQLKFSWQAKCQMLKCFMQHLWQPFEPFEDEDLPVLPPLHAIAARALATFPEPDERLRRFEARLRRLMNRSHRTSSRRFGDHLRWFFHRVR